MPNFSEKTNISIKLSSSKPLNPNFWLKVGVFWELSMKSIINVDSIAVMRELFSSITHHFHLAPKPEFENEMITHHFSATPSPKYQQMVVVRRKWIEPGECHY